MMTASFSRLRGILPTSVLPPPICINLAYFGAFMSFWLLTMGLRNYNTLSFRSVLNVAMIWSIGRAGIVTTIGSPSKTT